MLAGNIYAGPTYRAGISRGAKPVTTVQECISKFQSLKPLGNFRYVVTKSVFFFKAKTSSFLNPVFHAQTQPDRRHSAVTNAKLKTELKDN